MLVAVKLARYWTRASGEASGPAGPVRVTARGWSNDSLEAAREVARATARRLAERLVSRRDPPKAYLYGERPLPEPVLREFPGAGGPGAVVTRNGYGALVLNSAQLMFVDIDREDPAPSRAAGDLVSGILSLFGKAAPAPPPAAADGVVAGMKRVTEANRLAARVYQTAGGYRVIVTDQTLEPGSGASEQLLRQFGADPLYVRLCRLQLSFRARLTPKPWRCGLGMPPASFPFETPQDEARFRAWEAQYARAAEAYATCRYVTTLGGDRLAPGFGDLITYHDQETRATTDLPLA
jgi:hypothetical protein